LGPAYLANGRRRVEWLETWSCRNRVDAETLPKDARCHLHLGQQRLDFGEYSSAWEQFQLAVQEDPSLSGDILEHALRLFKEGRGNLAEEILVRLYYEPAAVALRPEIELACLVVAVDGGRTVEADRIYARYHEGIETASRSSTGWLDAVSGALDQTRTRVGRESLEDKAEAAVETQGLRTGDLALEETEEGNQALIGRLSRGTDDRSRLAPRRSSIAREALGRFVAGGRQDDEKRSITDVAAAIGLLSGAIRRSPANAQLRIVRARQYLAVHDLSAALVDATMAIRLAPDAAAGYKLRAAIYTLQGRFKPAVDDLTKANRINPGDPNVLTVRGFAYQHLGEGAKADADVRAANRLISTKE
jgi:tetratricopeptide (TPR) repeat protein